MATAPGLGSSGASQLPLDSKFCLKWNNHQVNIVKCFSNLLRNDRFVDVTLAAEGRFLQAHRVILSSCSPYFEDLFSLRPENNAIVFLKDVSFEELQALLDFMYKGEVSISQDKLGTFLRTAESLQIRGLTQSQKSKDSLHNSLTASVPQTSNKSTHKRRRQSEESSDIHSLEGRLSRSHNDGSQSQNQTTLPPLKHRTMLTRAESAADSRRKSQALESNDESVSGNVTFGVEGENIGHSEEWSDEDDAAAVKTDEVLVPQLDVSECQGSWNNSSEVGETAEAGPSRMSVQPLQPVAGMVTKPERKKRFIVPYEDVHEAVKEALQSKASMRKTAKKYGIPKSTLIDNVKKVKELFNGKIESEQQILEVTNTIKTRKERLAHQKVFTDQEESELASELQNSSDMLDGIKKVQARKMAYDYAKRLGREVPANWERDKTAGPDWLAGYLKRNATLRLKKPSS